MAGRVEREKEGKRKDDVSSLRMKDGGESYVAGVFFLSARVAILLPSPLVRYFACWY
jgi:hypothetical protein